MVPSALISTAVARSLAQTGRQLCPVRRFLQLGRFGLLLFGALGITPGAGRRLGHHPGE
jgi:hypothetical protein